MAAEGSLLFSWADVERLPDLERLGFVLEQLPDGGVVSALEAWRGRGRGDYPVRAMWRALVAGVVFGHASSASLLRELGRNPALLEACGFDPLGRQGPPVRTLVRGADGGVAVREEARPWRDGVPTAWACQCRLKIPQKCRSKIPQLGGWFNVAHRCGSACSRAGGRGAWGAAAA